MTVDNLDRIGQSIFSTVFEALCHHFLEYIKVKSGLRDLDMSPAVAPPVAPVALGKLNRAFCSNSMFVCFCVCVLITGQM